jgi:CheY-like chemotaxis protein
MAVNGQEGLAAWRTGRFDLILSDCHMPILDGFEMAQQIRADENATGIPQIPIIAVTANALDGEKERCQAHGMNGYLAKPVEIEKLKSIIKSHLSVSPREP